MQDDESKVLVQVYELILGRELMDALAEVCKQDQESAVGIMSVALKAKFGDIPPEEASQSINHLVANIKRTEESTN